MFLEILGFHLEIHHKKKHANRSNSIFMFNNFIKLFQPHQLVKVSTVGIEGATAVFSTSYRSVSWTRVSNLWICC